MKKWVVLGVVLYLMGQSPVFRQEVLEVTGQVAASTYVNVVDLVKAAGTSIKMARENSLER